MFVRFLLLCVLCGLKCELLTVKSVAINTPTLVRIRKRLISDIKGRSKDAPMIWQAQREYEKKHEKSAVRADKEMDIGV